MSKANDLTSLHIGTSGFSYSDWKDDFYPEGLPSCKQLEYFTGHFDTVELNSSFYHLPQQKTFVSWRERTPDDFTFAVKISRYITHRKYLKDCKEPWNNFYGRAKALKENLGPFLVQLPGRWTKNFGRIKNFVGILKEISPEERFTFEFRNQSWFDQEVINFFKHQDKITLCLTDSDKWPQLDQVTGKFVYIRFHGPDQIYQSKYSQSQLKSWADKINDYLNQGLDVYCYFNNDFNCYAIQDAKNLLKLIKG